MLKKLIEFKMFPSNVNKKVSEPVTQNLIHPNVTRKVNWCAVLCECLLYPVEFQYVCTYLVLDLRMPDICSENQIYGQLGKYEQKYGLNFMYGSVHVTMLYTGM